MIKTLNDALLRIEELEKENYDLRNRLSKYEGKKPAGRKVHGEAWSESYRDFVLKYEEGLSMSAIIETSSISRRTAYRYKKYYDMLMEEKFDSENDYVNEVTLLPMTDEMYHTFFEDYDNDIDLYLNKSQFVHYEYSKEKVQQYIKKQMELHRIPLAVMWNGEIVGEILIKNITSGESATMSIVLKNEKYKNRGIGSRAEVLAIRYVFDELNIPVLYADAIITNTRSQHVLEKVGFLLINQDNEFRYYKIERDKNDVKVTL